MPAGEGWGSHDKVVMGPCPGAMTRSPTWGRKATCSPKGSKQPQIWQEGSLHRAPPSWQFFQDKIPSYLPRVWNHRQKSTKDQWWRARQHLWERSSGWANTKKESAKEQRNYRLRRIWGQIKKNTRKNVQFFFLKKIETNFSLRQTEQENSTLWLIFTFWVRNTAASFPTDLRNTVGSECLTIWTTHQIHQISRRELSESVVVCALPSRTTCLHLSWLAAALEREQMKWDFSHGLLLLILLPTRFCRC